MNLSPRIDLGWILYFVIPAVKILGVTIQAKLKVSTHVTDILAKSMGTLHALRILRFHGLPACALQEVARATLVARMIYAIPAWWGLTNAEERCRLEKVLVRDRRAGYLSMDIPDVEMMVTKAEDTLLSAVQRNSSHVLTELFQHTNICQYFMCPRPHDYVRTIRTLRTIEIIFHVSFT